MSSTAHVLTIDPVTRLEGHLRAAVTVDYVQGQLQVIDAQIGGTLFRGFENILVGRSPLDAPDICERICGVCTVSHGLASCLALESAAGMTSVPNNARVMRNLILAADMLHSHIMHFYVLSLADFAEIQPMPPWTPAWPTDRRLSGSAAAQLTQHYIKALEIRRKAHEMGAHFAGRLPHSPAFVPGGITTTPRQARIDAYRAYASEVLNFVQNEYQADVSLVASAYSDYYAIGAGARNLIAYGSFDLDSTGNNKLFRSGVVQNASTSPALLDVNAIEEDSTRAWYHTVNTYFRANCGGTAYTDSQGSAWSADYGFNSGGPRSTTTNIQGTSEQALYRTWRLAASGTPLIYTYNVPNGDYTVTLKFDETYWTQAGQRVFDVAINGQTVLPSFDILAAGGPNTAVDRQFPVTVTSGQIVIQFTSIVDRAKICAIEMIGSAVQVLPTVQVRVNGGGAAYSDPQGTAWSADYGFNSGSSRSTTVTIQGTNAQALYRIWRLATIGTPLIYTYNVPNGDYTVTLKFDETYWTQAGQRVFDVAINGLTVLPSFDILAAGGVNTAVDRQFLVTVTSGQIVIGFTSIVDRAKICALEIVGGQPHVALHPFSGTTTPIYPKTGAYSWTKSPRYRNEAYEAGPLARMWINGDYRSGISVMDRHMARFREALKLALQLDSWAQELLPTGPVYQQYTPPTTGSGYGLTEAPRGALGHWVKIAGGKIALYQVVTPTCWNCSPRDSAGAPGPLEKALLGLPVQNLAEPVEVVRVIHSFDPCLACSVHLMRPSEKGLVFRL